VLTSQHNITVELEDRLPAPLRDLNCPDKNNLFFGDSSDADPPVWNLPINPLGLLCQLESQYLCQNDSDGRYYTDGLTSKNLLTALASRLANFSREIVL